MPLRLAEHASLLVSMYAVADPCHGMQCSLQMQTPLCVDATISSQNELACIVAASDPGSKKQSRYPEETSLPCFTKYFPASNENTRIVSVMQMADELRNLDVTLPAGTLSRGLLMWSTLPSPQPYQHISRLMHFFRHTTIQSAHARGWASLHTVAPRKGAKLSSTPCPVVQPLRWKGCLLAWHT